MVTQEKAESLRANCPECRGRIAFDIWPQLGQPVICPVCFAYLEIVLRDPLVLDWSSMETYGALFYDADFRGNLAFGERCDGDEDASNDKRLYDLGMETDEPRPRDLDEEIQPQGMH